MNKRLSAKQSDPQSESAPLPSWALPDPRYELELSTYIVHPFWQILDPPLLLVAAAAAVTSVNNRGKQLERRC